MISIFTTASNPIQRGDNIKEALNCYTELADEVVLIGDYTDKRVNSLMNYWPYEFSWEFIGKQFQRGYETLDTDFVLHMDLDFFFHEKDHQAIRQALEQYPNSPAVSFYKWQFILPDRYNLKSRLLLAVNKKKFGERIKFNGGGDLCQPTLDGVDLDINEMPQSGIAFYNYEKLTKTKEQIMDDVGRMDRAYMRHFGKWLYSEDGTNKSAYEGWYRMVKGRFNKPHKSITLSEHPKYIQETIKNLKPENFGYNGFGLIEGRVYES